MHSNILHFKTIGVATDLSETASSTLRYAQTMAGIYQATLVLIHVIDPLAYAFPEGAPAILTADASAREELKKIEAQTRELGIAVHSAMETGTIHERILEAMNDGGVDLLILGTRAQAKAGRVALGTVARQLLARSRCPILTVSPETDVSLFPWAGCWRRVLAATDFSPASIRALQCAHQLALRQLTILHVSNEKQEQGEQEQEGAHCREMLRFLAPFNEAHSVPIEHLVVPGAAADLIAEKARTYGVDLVVLGSPENELAEANLPSSTVLQVISRVTCPVLCLPFVADGPDHDVVGTEVAA